MMRILSRSLLQITLWGVLLSSICPLCMTMYAEIVKARGLELVYMVKIRG
jgi:hypothetical protein